LSFLNRWTVAICRRLLLVVFGTRQTPENIFFKK